MFRSLCPWGSPRDPCARVRAVSYVVPRLTPPQNSGTHNSPNGGCHGSGRTVNRHVTTRAVLLAQGASLKQLPAEGEALLAQAIAGPLAERVDLFWLKATDFGWIPEEGEPSLVPVAFWLEVHERSSDESPQRVSRSWYVALCGLECLDTRSSPRQTGERSVSCGIGLGQLPAEGERS